MAEFSGRTQLNPVRYCPRKADFSRNTTKLNPVVRVILQGLYDKGSPLNVLLGMHYILKVIWHDVLTYYKSKIATPRDSELFFTCSFFPKISFPEPKNININMMLFVMTTSFKDTKLPYYLRPYFDQIVRHCIAEDERGKIGYLTIHESFVEKGKSQRRPGIHTESLMLKGGKGEWIQRRQLIDGRYSADIYMKMGKKLQGGIYMASSVPGWGQVWNCNMLKSEGCNSPDVVGEHGDIEHLRSILPRDSKRMLSNVIYWMTDRTPHESLRLHKERYGQYIRLVTSQVSDWCEDLYTKNPLGVVPYPSSGSSSSSSSSSSSKNVI